MNTVYFVVLLIAIVLVGVVAVFALVLSKKKSNTPTTSQGIPPELQQQLQDEHGSATIGAKHCQCIASFDE